MTRARLIQRICLGAMGTGLFLIGQPWLHGGFAAGFPLTLAAILIYNAAGWAGGPRDPG